MIFNPCTGQCTKEGTHCEGCGRSHEDVAGMRKLVASAAEFAIKKEYENPEDFAKAFGHSISYMIEANQP